MVLGCLPLLHDLALLSRG
jgi:hypothetical protein